MNQQPIFNTEEVKEFLTKIGQEHLVSEFTKHTEEEVQAFVQQINRINNNYPGGLTEYVARAQKDLVNPYEGYSVHVPQGESLSLDDVKTLSEFEAIGVKELGQTCFVLVAGGLGERLGYDGIKIGIPIELTTKQTFLEYYIQYILAFQRKHSNHSTLSQTIGPNNAPLPFAIMTSDDTHALTLQLLQQNEYFGMPQSQITLLKQEKIPAMVDNEARFALIPGKLLLDTKPHGHGDIHTLLYMSGLANQWATEGRQWLFIFQDTNPFALRALPSVLGVSKQRGFEVIHATLISKLNSIAVPRKKGEAVGAICELRNQTGTQITINVEYNQLEPLMNTIGGEPCDSEGFSKFPGNINSLLFSLGPYNKVLNETQGLIAEFINPKYADASRTKFKSATRLECMMQDYPKLLSPTSPVGFTLISRNFCFTTCKNDLATATQKYQQKMALECAGSCESDFYRLNAKLLQLAGADIEVDQQEQVFSGIGFHFGPQVILHPSFGVTLEEIKSRVKGNLKVTKRSTFVVQGEATLCNVSVDGVLALNGNGTFNDVQVNDAQYHQFVNVNLSDSNLPPYLKIRGYTLQK